jgi:8-oxo-dGTP pyrophosphatase MutT (NUDIX family)
VSSRGARGWDRGQSLRHDAPELVASRDPRLLVDGLAAYHPDDSAQAATRDRMLEFLHRHADAFWRTCVPGHFTGSALVLDDRGERALLHHHRKLDRWLQPGGHADGNTNLAAVALREAHEETGIAELSVHPEILDLDIHEIPARGDEPSHLHLDVRYLVFAPPAARFVVSAESHQLAWLTVSEARRLGIDASVERLFAKAFAD